MPASYTAIDHGIAADHSHSIVVDIPFGLRGGIPVYGVPFYPHALVMAAADGHPRAIGYVARVPENTIKALDSHPFYRYLVAVQHEVPGTCLLDMHGCDEPAGVVPPNYIPPVLSRIVPTPADIAAARKDAAQMHIGWVVVWKRNISDTAFVLPYLRETGFRFDYRESLGTSKDSVLVYRHIRH
jgi:hypothetical protein